MGSSSDFGAGTIGQSMTLMYNGSELPEFFSWKQNVTHFQVKYKLIHNWVNCQRIRVYLNCARLGTKFLCSTQHWLNTSLSFEREVHSDCFGFELTVDASTKTVIFVTTLCEKAQIGIWKSSFTFLRRKTAKFVHVLKNAHTVLKWQHISSFCHVN